MSISNDTVRPYGHALYLQFAGTGESRSASTLQLDQGITVGKDGASLVGRYHLGGSQFIIERFSSETLASNALAMIEAAMQRFAKRQRWKTAGKGLVLWFFAPAIAAMFALAFNAAATHTMVPGPSAAPVAYAPALPMQAAPTPPSTTAAAQPPAAEVAKGMADAVKDGRFSVKVSAGTKGPLYVFSDPSCPHCQDFERQLDILTKSYTIHILPVDVVGGALSSGRIAQMLCLPPNERQAAWKKLITGAGLGGAKQCAEGSAAGTADDRIFRALGLPGTPSIVSADGRIMPDTMSLKADSVDAWAQSPAR